MAVTRIDAESYTLIVMLREGGLECRVTFIPRSEGVMLDREALLSHLHAQNVICGIDEEAVTAFCAATGGGETLEAVLLAVGFKPEPGTDGYLEIISSGEEKEVPGGDDEPEGTMDLRSVAMLATVSAGEPIARLRPPEEGKPGMSVSGEPIPPPAPKSPQFKAGDGVSCAEGDVFVAEKSGRLVIQDGVVAVSEEYVIAGNVDFKVGHVRFPGVVTVRGDVLDDFNVYAGKGLIVTGVVGACMVESEGAIQMGGMSGQKKGCIRAGGDIQARYLNEVTVECEGSVTVEKEIVNSTIKCAGRVICGGHLVGGTCIARAGIEAKVFGSLSGLSTRLVAGTDYRDAEVLESLYPRIRELSAKIDGARDRQVLDELHKEKAALQKEVMQLKTKRYGNENAKINVVSKILDQVSITLGNTTGVVADVAGSFSIIENIAEGGLCYFNRTPLEVNTAETMALLDKGGHADGH